MNYLLLDIECVPAFAEDDPFIKKWVKKAYFASLKPSTRVVCLLPARTDTKWFHRYCAKGEIWFIEGRLKFGGAKNSAPFPSMIVFFGFPPKPRSE